jgi:uncharacterized protein (DUF1684 family)
MIRQRRLTRFVFLLTGGLVACVSPPGGSMVAVPPPADWQAEIQGTREEKDELFATDPTSPLLVEDLAGFEGLTYWPPDAAYYYLGPVNLYANPEQFNIVTTAGQPRKCARVGWIEFERDGEALTLQVYRLLDQNASRPDDYFLPFTDVTTGVDTYPAGRYVELEGPEGGPYVLDFNRAYNPLCAYGAPERYACPVTPPENRLPVRIEAGERGYKRMEAGG